MLNNKKGTFEMLSYLVSQTDHQTIAVVRVEDSIFILNIETP